MPTIVRSTDAAAIAAGAVLTGNAGSLIAVLDYALVTVLGWGKPFAAANKGVYRPPAGVRHYLDVDDSGPDATALGRNARIRGYETMSAVGTGTGPFPTVAQVTTPVFVKSIATGVTARPWLLIGDDRTFYFHSSAGGTDPPTLATNIWTDGFFFGEILSALTGDLYRTIIGYPSTTTAAITAAFPNATVTSAGTTTTLNYNMPRTYLGTGPSIWALPIGNPFFGGAFISGGIMAFPNPVDGGLYANAVDVGERGSGATPGATSGIRGRLRGLYQPAEIGDLMNDQDTFTGVGDFLGKTFIVLRHRTAGPPVPIWAFDTTAWAASA